VLETFDGTDLGYSCFPLKPTGNCPAFPYTTVTTLTTIDGNAVDVCLPRRTTCAGVNQGRRFTPCALDTDCGEIGLDDGACNTSVANGQCSVPCAIQLDCLNALSTCSGDAVCR
jgi:hypothetical protein